MKAVYLLFVLFVLTRDDDDNFFVILSIYQIYGYVYTVNVSFVFGVDFHKMEVSLAQETSTIHSHYQRRNGISHISHLQCYSVLFCQSSRSGHGTSLVPTIPLTS